MSKKCGSNSFKVEKSVVSKLVFKNGCLEVIGIFFTNLNYIKILFIEMFYINLYY